MITQKKSDYYINYKVSILALMLSFVLIVVYLLQSGYVFSMSLIVASLLILFNVILIYYTWKRNSILNSKNEDYDNAGFFVDNNVVNDKTKDKKILDLLIANNKLLKSQIANNFKNNYEKKKNNNEKLQNRFKEEYFMKTQVAVVKDEKSKLVELINEVMKENYSDSTFDVQRLADKLYMSRAQLYRKFKSVSKVPIAQYLRSYRLAKAKSLLEETDINVSQIMYKTGFINLTSFSRAFKNEFGISPTEYRKNLDISYVHDEILINNDTNW